MPSELEKSIAKTAAYFSIFSYPLTSFEIWKWLSEPDREYSLFEVRNALEKSEFLKKMLETDCGFFFLRGAGISIRERNERTADSHRKFKRLKRVARFLSLIPWIDGIAACNTLAWSHTTEKSDIDLLIITQPNSLWSARLFAVLPFALLHQRPHERARDPLCFSFFLNSDAMDLSKIKLKDDPYLSAWVPSVVPVFDRGNVFDEFWQANLWVKQLFPNSFPVFASANRRVGLKLFSMNAPKWLESFLKRIQMRRMPASLSEQAKAGIGVVINNDMIKLYSADRREEIAERWRKEIEKY
ncbi:MAG: hypothetical protein ACD_76C00114G0001 [uncultured bacterium]|nr:MAG: hypothetical protein ACD_76C00114G0001 [uncultured bacterium]HBD05341.1 hypothetical protein [Candidatus Uhrbacteria bacterium]